MVPDMIRLIIIVLLPWVFAQQMFAQTPEQVNSKPALTSDEIHFFETKIRPVLIKECYGCHSSKAGNARGGLTLDTKERMAIGGATGPAVVPGNLEESLLYQAICYSEYEMPPNGQLSSQVIDDFRRWIEMGAPDPRSQQVQKIQATITEDDIDHAKSTFWAYRDPVGNLPGPVSDEQWAISEIDRYILAELELSNLKPSVDASSTDVLRRLSFDLIGLPPTPQQIAFFETMWAKDPNEAISYVADRLLDSSHFGERWGRHWMDVVRYGESSGRSINMTYPNAWRYRDYIIQSFNKDKPYDQFVQEQIAGDLLPVDTDDDFADHLIATTFLAIGSKNVNENNRVQFAADLVDEQIDATTRVFLGMSVACARCHDHKFDAIRQSDYYALAGIFQSTKTYFGNPQSELGAFSDPTDKQTSNLIILPVDRSSPYATALPLDKLAQIREQMEQERLAMLQSRQRSQGNPASAQRERNLYNRRMAELSGILASVDKEGKPKSFCMGVQDADQAVDAKLLVRGEIDQAADRIPRGFPSVLVRQQPKIRQGSSGRLELARWIGSEQNTLAARVMVNRIWMHLIGAGIVRSTENFGVTGEPPSHPELLDYLALRFIDSGWSVKSLIRDIVTSRTYRISSEYNEAHHQVDPDNQLVWRANPRRLDAEAIRDAMLSISGELDTKPPNASLVAALGYTRVIGGRVIPNRSMMTALGFDLSMPSLIGGQNQAGMLGGQARRGFAQGRFGGNSMMRSRSNSVERSNLGGEIMRSLRDGSQFLDAESAKYRSVYLPLVRDAEPRALAVFDLADTSVIIGKRETSNTANQSLYLMNNPFVQQQSDAFAKRLTQHGDPLSDQIDQAVLLAFGRYPTTKEKETLSSFITENKSMLDLDDDFAAMRVVCQSLFASAEFLFLD